MIPEQYRLKTTVKHPTSLIIGGLSRLGLEITESLLEQGGYVIIADNYTSNNLKKLKNFSSRDLVSFIDYSSIPDLDDELRRLDYIFFFTHESTNFSNKVSTQDFLKFSNYLDSTLAICSKFETKFLLTTAIKAHQLVVNQEDFGRMFDASIKHKVYTEMETQRYAESLVMEYVEKTNLDARIVRVGEIIGEGIDFVYKSPFTTLILEAASGDVLHLHKDGLESDWYVHTLDAAYGIIKAQFSKGTSGQIYSICYETPYTNLSLAYKIQEIENGTKEIKFLDEKDNLPSLKFYKPAPNLSVIGWMPRVSFDKAVKQSIAAAKIYVIEKHTNDVNRGKGENGADSKLQNFLTLANKSNSSNDLGPINQLLEERKMMENLKKERINLANNSIRVRRRGRPKTFREKISKLSWDFVTSLGNTFSFLKYRTPLEFGILMVLFLVLVIFYFNILSPLLALTRNALVFIPEYQKLSKEINDGNYEHLHDRATKIQTTLEDSRKILSIYKGTTDLFALGDTYDTIDKTMLNYAQFAEGLKDIGYSYEPFYEYMSNFENNTQVRNTSDSLISVAKPGIDFSQQMEMIQDRSPYLENGLRKIDQTNEEIQKYQYNSLPEFISKKIVDINTKVNDFASESENFASYKYLPELLGEAESKAYLLLLLDNTRLTPIGGDIAGFAIITVENGSIADIVVKPAESIDYNFSSVNDTLLKTINNRKFTYVKSPTLKISDITNLSEYSEFADTAKNIWGDTLNLNIDGVATINLETLKDLLALVPQDQNITINGVTITSSNFLNNINQTQVGNVNLTEKYRVETEIFANILFYVFNNIKTNYPLLSTLLGANVTTSNLAFDTTTLKYKSYVKAANLNLTLGSDANFFVTPAIYLEDSKVVSVDRFLSASYSIKQTILEDYKMTFELDFSFPTLGSSQEVSICLPRTVSYSSIQILDNFPKERYTINNENNSMCVVFKVLSENSVSLKWNVDAVFNQNLTDFKLLLNEVNGVDLTSIDYSIETTKSFTQVPLFNKVDTKTYFLKTDLEKDLLVEIKK